MPEKERKDEAYSESHPPRDEQERGGLHVLELPQHRHPLWHFTRRLSENLHQIQK